MNLNIRVRITKKGIREKMFDIFPIGVPVFIYFITKTTYSFFITTSSAIILGNKHIINNNIIYILSVTPHHA